MNANALLRVHPAAAHTATLELAWTRPPKSNGVLLLCLSVVVIGVSAGLYYGATHRKLGNSDRPHYDTVVKWVWGYGIGTLGIGLVVIGIIVLAIGK